MPLLYGVFGPGNLGGSLLKCIHSVSITPPVFYHPREERCHELRQIGKSVSIKALVTADVVFITVKPNMAEEACRVLRKALVKLESHPLIVSVMAGVPLSYLQEKLGSKKVVRAMLDLSIEEYNGSGDIFVSNDPDLRTLCQTKLSPLGYVQFVPEEKIDPITAVIGCGLAFVARFYQSYVESAKKLGLSEDEDIEDNIMSLFNRTIVMVGHNSVHKLIDRVACKGGATERGLQHLDFDQQLVDCMSVANNRCLEIRDEYLNKL